MERDKRVEPARKRVDETKAYKERNKVNPAREKALAKRARRRERARAKAMERALQARGTTLPEIDAALELAIHDALNPPSKEEMERREYEVRNAGEKRYRAHDARGMPVGTVYAISPERALVVARVRFGEVASVMELPQGSGYRR